MPWAKIDDSFTDHPKIDRLSDGAFRLHVGAICHCARYLTDGFVAADRVPRLAPRYRRKHVDELVMARLWCEKPGGWEINDYLDYNPSSDTVLREREREREKKRRQRTAGAGRAYADGAVDRGDSGRFVSPGDNPGDNPGDSDGDSPGGVPVYPSRPVPLVTSPPPTHVSSSPPPGGRQALIDQATAIVIADEIARRNANGDPVRTPDGYTRTRHTPVRAQHEAAWHELLERTPDLTAQQLADYAVGRLRATPLDDTARAARALRERDRSCPTCAGSGLTLDHDDLAVPCTTCRTEETIPA